MIENENDILRRVRKIEIKTRGLSNEIFAGKYHTAFRGRGMSFSEVLRSQMFTSARLARLWSWMEKH